MTPEHIKATLKSLGVREKKSLSQNFLIDEHSINSTVASAGNLNNANVLEVGPGLGFITDYILNKTPYSITLVEKDDKFSGYLKNKFTNNKNIEIVNEDILKFEEESITSEDKKTVVIANLPFNITSKILTKWIYKAALFDRIVIIVQEEMAQKIVAPSGSERYSVITVMLNIFFNVQELFVIPADGFYPEPKCNASVLHLSPADNIGTGINELKTVINAAFNMRRKTILHAMKKIFGDETSDVLESLNISKDSRATDISPDKFRALSALLR